MAKEYSRTQRVADQLQRELAILLQTEVKDPRVGMVTVSAVTLSRDLAYARVYVTTLSENVEDRAQALSVLNKAGGFLRSMLAKRIQLRVIPKLNFIFDESTEYGNRLSSLIDRAVGSPLSEKKENRQ